MSLILNDLVEQSKNQIKNSSNEHTQAILKKKSKSSKINKQEIEGFINQYYDIRFNIVISQAEYKLKTVNDFKRIDDFEANSILRCIEANVACNKKTFCEIIESDFARKFDPIREYFENIEDWDGDYHIKRFSNAIRVKNDGLGFTQDEFEAFFRKFLIGVVAQAYDGRTNHLALILQSEKQGTYKTSTLQKLVPKSLSDYKYEGSIQDNKDFDINFCSNILIIDDELESLNKTSLGLIKRKLTQSDFKIRPPYGRTHYNLKRRASFCGSVNKPDFLKDETGNRRLIIISVDKILFEESIKGFDIDKLYSEAFHAYKNNEEFWLSPEEISLINSKTEAFMKESTTYEFLTRFFESISKEDFDKDNPKHHAWQTGELGIQIQNRIQIMFTKTDNNNNNVSRFDSKSITKDITSALQKGKFIKDKRRIGARNPCNVWLLNEIDSDDNEPELNNYDF